GQVVSPDGDAPIIVGTIATIFVSLCALFFATEPERMSRRTRLLVPRAAGKAWSAIAFLPGGGRGLWLLLFHFALVLLAVAVLTELTPVGSSARSGQALLSVLVLQCY